MIYQNLQVSIQRFCADFAAANGCSFANFDSSWDEAELPRSDVCGPLGLTFELDEKLIEGSVQIGVTTLDDTNLLRLSGKIAKLTELLLPTNKIKLYDATTGAELGLLVIQNGTKVMPVAGNKARPVQFVGISFQSTVAYRLDGVTT